MVYLTCGNGTEMLTSSVFGYTCEIWASGSTLNSPLLISVKRRETSLSSCCTSNGPRWISVTFVLREPKKCPSSAADVSTAHYRQLSRLLWESQCLIGCHVGHV